MPVCGYCAGYLGLGLVQPQAQIRLEIEDFRPDPSKCSGAFLVAQPSRRESLLGYTGVSGPCDLGSKLGENGPIILFQAVVLPGRKAVFRAAFRPDSGREGLNIGPPAGLRPAGGPLLRRSPSL